MMAHVKDINNRLQILGYQNDVESLYLAVKVFELNRDEERALARLRFSNFPLIQGLIKVKNIDDNLGIKWDSEAGKWVVWAIGKQLAKAKRSLDPCHHNWLWAMKKYLSWFELDEGFKTVLGEIRKVS